MTGTGTEADPYVITTLTDLQNMNNDLDAYYVLGNDIDASGTAAWNGGEGFVPIGSSATPFTGTFDGKGYTITGLTIARPATDYVGLFGYVKADTDYPDVQVKNVILAAVDITGDDKVGALIGLAEDAELGAVAVTVRDVTIAGTITGDYYIGGVVGVIDGNLGSTSTYSDCTTSCTVTGGAYVGGFVGDLGYATVARCYATGAVSGEAYVGGFAGTIVNYGDVDKCYATGAATGTDNYVGGFAGYIGLGTITDCYARGAATGDASKDGTSAHVGGFVGYSIDNTITRCFATGVPTGTTNVGGFTGFESVPHPTTYTDCVWDTTTSGTLTACGSGVVSGVTGYTTTEMKDGTATEGWSPVDWDLITASNNGYACLLGITPGCTPPTTPNIIGDRTVVVEKPVLELIRNVEVQLDGRFYIDKNGNAVYESRFHRG